VRIVSFSLEVLAPRPPVAVSVSFSLLSWARSVPTGDVIGRVIHSRRFKEFKGGWRGSSRVDVDLDHLTFPG